MDAAAGGSGSGPSQRRPACAICRQQKRWCPGSCPTAPYFPFPPTQDLRDVQRLFGLGNLTKIRNSVPAGPQRETAMRTMIWEARMRRLDPVRGACGVVERLAALVKAAQGELESVRRHLAVYRPRGQAEEPQPPQQQQQHQAVGGGGGVDGGSPQCRNSTEGRNAEDVLRQLVDMLGGDEDVLLSIVPPVAGYTDYQEGLAAAAGPAQDPTNQPPAAASEGSVDSNNE